MHEVALGIDIGGTKLAAGIVTAAGDVVSFVTAPTPTDWSSGSQTLLDLAAGAIEQAGAYVPTLVGIGSCGPLDVRSGILTNPLNLVGWRNAPVRETVSSALGLPAILNNDATAAAAGEWMFGAGKGCSNLIYLTISTGIGGGVVVGDRLFLGSSGNGGELGHVIVARDGRKCNCPQWGCLEAHCSGTAIAQIAVERLVRDTRPSMLRAAGDLTAASVSRAAAAGDPLAAEIWDEAMTLLAEGITSVANVFEPEVIVLGGGVTSAGSQLLDPVASRVASHALIAREHLPRVVLAPSGPQVGVLGAAAAAMHLAEFDS